MKKDKTINTSPARQILVIALVTITMFVLGYFVGQGLYYFFS